MGKLGYDESKDKFLDHREIQIPDSKSVLIVSLYSYDDGNAKIQINRSIKKGNGDTMYVKTGRFTLDEFNELAKVVVEMFSKLK